MSVVTRFAVWMVTDGDGNRLVEAIDLVAVVGGEEIDDSVQEVLDFDEGLTGHGTAPLR